MTRVLAIDDEPDILAIVEGVLSANGHYPIVTADPREAVTLAVSHQAEVIVLDVSMPELSGFETLEALRSNPQTSGLPILFLSALGNSEHKIRGLRKGADDYLAKPFAGDELVLRIEILAARTQRRGMAVSCSTAHELDLAVQDGDFRSNKIYLGRYQALEVIGQGGMGLVLRGWDPTLRRHVALKTVRLDKLGGGPNSGDRFVAQLTQEATALARFNHPNIVGVHDAGVGEDVAFVVMELVVGVSLMDVLFEEHLKIGQSAHLVISIANALAAAHAHEITHRDVKPGNILLSYEGAVKVTDFGLADTMGSLAEQHKIFGTPGYVPPEVFLGLPFGPHGDVFALGAVLYRCLTGSPAFWGDSLPKLLANNLAAQPVPPKEVRDDIPTDLSILAMDMLSKEPDQRPSATEVQDRLADMQLVDPGWDALRLRSCKRTSRQSSTFSATMIDLPQ